MSVFVSCLVECSKVHNFFHFFSARISPEGGINVAYNCVDRHAYANPDKTAILYEADEPGKTQAISYAELLRETSRIANVLKHWGVKKGDTVSIYLPMTW